MKNKILWILVIINFIANIIIGYFILSPYILPESPWEKTINKIVNDEANENYKKNEELRSWVIQENKRVLEEVNKINQEYSNSTVKEVTKMLR